MKLPNCLKNLNSRKGNEKGSVTLFVLIAMLFFLMIGMMIFIINMNTETSQKRDVEKIKSEYNANTSETDLEQLYQEAKQRQIGTFMIKLIDKYGKIYNSGEWVNENWLAEGRLPLTVQPNFPEGLKDISVTVKDDTYGGSTIITKTADLATMEIRADKDCQYTIENTLDNTNQVKINIDTTKPTIDELKGGTIWKGTEEEEITGTDAGGAITITARDNLSGVKELKYIINNSPEAPSADAEWTTAEGATAQVTINNENDLGVYYIHAMATDVAGNVRDVVTSGPYEVKQANYKITTTTGTTYSETLKDAAEIPGAMVIKVLNTFTDEVPATIAQNVTVDTNGKTLTMAETITIAANTTATFVDNATTKGKLERTTGTLITNNGTTTVNGATLNSNNGVISGGTVNVEDGIVSSTGNGAIGSTNATINGGSITSTNGHAIQTSNTMNITGGTISSPSGVAPLSGTLNISGTSTINGGNYGIWYGNWQTPTINISGGAINSTNKYAIYGEGSSRGNITITGGTITSNASNAIAIGANSRANISITGGTITGATDGISMTGANSTLTIGDNTNALDRTAPVITGTTGTGINIAGATSTLNYYDGTIIGKEKGTKTFNGREVAFSEKDDTTVNFLTETEEGNVTRYYRPYTRENEETHLFETVLEKQVNVTFNPGEGATVAENNRNVLTNVEYKEKAEDATIVSLPTPEKTGYTFKGWNGKNLFNKDDTPERPDYYITGDGNNYYHVGYSILKISLKPNTIYTITNSGNSFNPGYVVYDSSETRLFGENYSNRKVITFTTPSTASYIKFSVVTQESSANYEKDIFQIEEGTTATPYEQYYIENDTKVVQDQDHELKAIWEVNKYTVHFDKNDSQEAPVTGEMSDQEFTYGQEQALTTNAYTRTGYTFKGWNTSADGSGTPYSDGQTVSNLTTENGVAINLYAQWMENNYYNTVQNKYYETLTDALADIPTYSDGDTVQTIEVQNSRTEPADKAPTLAANKKAIIDLKGQTTTLNQTLTNNGTLEIKDTATNGTITRAGDVITNNSYAAATVSSGIITATSGYAIKNNGNGIVTVTGGNVTSNSGNAVYNGGSGTVEIRGGNVTSDTSYAINNDSTGKISVTGGNVTGATIGIYSRIAAPIEIKGGNITATDTALWNNKEGTVDVTAGTITGRNGIWNNGTGTVNVSGANTTITGNTGVGIRGYIGTVNVYSGTITGGKHGISIETANGTNGTLTMGTKDSTVSKDLPAVISTATSGNYYGVYINGANTTFNFYDGKVTGYTGHSLNAQESDKPDHYQVVKTTADGKETAVLEKEVVVTAYANGGIIKTTPEGWTPKEENTKADKTMLTNTAYGTLPSVSRTGYTLKGWKINGEGDFITNETIVTTTSDHTLNAIWEANPYTVTADANGGSIPATEGWTGTGDTATKSVTFDSQYGTLPIPTRVGYDFQNWTGKNLLKLDVPRSAPSDITYGDSTNRKFTSNTYVRGLAFNNYYKPANVDNITINQDNVKVTAKYGYGTGYVFETNGNKRYTLSYNADNDGAISSVLFYNEDGNLISYSRVNGSGNKQNVYTTPQNTHYMVVALCNGSGSMTELTFANIMLEEGTVATNYEPYRVIAANTTVSSAANHKVYANWTPKQYTVHFDANGGTPTPADKTVTFDSAYGAMPEVSKTGYTFKGWKINGEGDYITADTIVKTPNDHTLTAIWEATPYTVTLNAGDGTIDAGDDGWARAGDNKTATKDITYDSDYGTLPTASRPGYEFDGWFTEATGGTKVTDTTKMQTASEQTLYPHWTANPYTIHFNANGGTGEMSDEAMTYDVEKALTKNTFTKTGYSFEGWSQANNSFENRLLYSNDEEMYAGHNAFGNSTNEFIQYANFAPYFNRYGTNAKYRLEYDVMSENTTRSNRIEAYFQNGSTTKYEFYPNSDLENLVNEQRRHCTIVSSTEWTHDSLDFRIKRLNNSETLAMLAFYGVYGTGNKPRVKNVRLYIIPDYTDEEVVKNLTAEKNGEVTLYANWEANKYTVTANANGGTISTAEGWDTTGEKPTKSVTYDSAYGTLPEVTKTGYTLKGWNGKNQFNKDATPYKTSYYIKGDGAEVHLGEYTLYQINVEPNTVYTITNSGGSTAPGYVVYNSSGTRVGGENYANKKYITFTTPSTAAYIRFSVVTQTSSYRFDKNTFQIEKNNEATTYEPYYITSETPVTTASNHDINAVWEANKYTVTLNAGDGTIDAGDDGWARAGDNKTATKDITYDSDYGTLPTASRTGYTFDGWYTDATNGIQITDVSIMQTASAQSLYAHWTANNYTIHFDANGGTGEMADLPMTYGTPANLTANAFSRTGYKFVKWTSNADGTGNEYIDGQTVNNLTEINNDTVNLFAQWEERPFVVTFNPNGGIVTPESKEITYNSTYGDLPSGDNIKRLGYTFAGWYKEAELTNEVTSETTYDITEDSTLYAKWTPHVYTVTFNKNGGTGTMSDQSFTYGQTQNLRANTFTRNGYTFAGWARAENGTIEFTNEQSISNLTPENGGTITLYAVWNDVTRPSWSVRLLDIINK